MLPWPHCVPINCGQRVWVHVGNRAAKAKNGWIFFLERERCEKKMVAILPHFFLLNASSHFFPAIIWIKEKCPQEILCSLPSKSDSNVCFQTGHLKQLDANFLLSLSPSSGFTKIHHRIVLPKARLLLPCTTLRLWKNSPNPWKFIPSGYNFVSKDRKYCS